ncbi:MAG TPA: DUF1565 domain-containing protein, partial [Myxococcaceae bacterium]
MLKNWKAHLSGVALVAVVGVVGCYDFGDARTRCEQEGRCGAQPDGGRPDGGGGECIPTGTDDPPDDNFEDSNCDGVDGIATAGIFVDPEFGDDGALGTGANPVKTISRAVTLLQSGLRPGVTALYLARGTYNEAQLVLPVPVSLYGGYAGRGNWSRDESYITHVDGGRVGMTLERFGDAGVILDRLSVSSANVAVADGTPSIALHLIGSQGVQLRYSTFAAGQGAPGRRGNNGPSGADGGSGDAGITAVQGTAGNPGPPGISVCGTDYSGGGGRPGGGETAGLVGLPGRPIPLGGGGGTGGTIGAPMPPTAGATRYDCTAGTGDAGTPGTSGDAGVAGERGLGLGYLLSNTWVATVGSTGTPGSNGTGGGGGGSGGGCPTEPNTGLAGAAGGGSGGGGGGGCGGGAGEGGGGGGASISILLVTSDVRFEGNVVLST